MQFLEVEKIRRLPQPPQEEVLDEIFPHPDTQEWVADWGLTGGEVDILLGADMIHLFPKLDYTVERLSLYMSFLTGRYIAMGQLPDNALEEQLEAVRRFSEEQRGRGLHLTTLPRIESAALPLLRRPTSLRTVTRGPNRRGSTLQAPAQRHQGQRWGQQLQHNLVLQQPSDLRHRLQTCL